MKRYLALIGIAALVTACPMDFATFIVDVGDDMPVSAATYIGADKTEMECAEGECRTGADVGTEGPARIELVYDDGSIIECAIPPMDFGYSGTMRFVVEENACSVS